MWLLLALVAAAATATLMDGFAADDSGSGDPDDTMPGDDADERADLRAASLPGAGQDGSGDMLSGPDPAAGDHPGLFDDLGERVHSSDAFPLPEPVTPGVMTADDEGRSLRGSGAGDTLIGGAGDDTLLGGGGDVILSAGSGNNHLVGGEGNDRLIGGPGDDTLEGGWGDDLLVSGGGTNVMMGGAGDDTLVGVHLDAGGRDISGPGFLNGGAGADLLIAGQGDMLHGGEDADIFALGDWLAGAEPATILDYTATEDQIILHYDPERLSAPEVTITQTMADPGTAEVRLDGQIIAYVVNAPDLTAADIALVSGLPPAALAAE